MNDEASSLSGPAGEQTWSVVFHVREDAERVFVRADQVPGAGIGDVITLVSPDAAEWRRGRVVSTDDDERGTFLAVELE